MEQFIAEIIINDLDNSKNKIRLINTNSLEVREFYLKDKDRVLRWKCFNEGGWDRKQCRIVLKKALKNVDNYIHEK